MTTVVANPNATNSPRWQDYLTVNDDVLPWLQMTTSTLNAAQTSNLELLTSAICTWAQNYLGQPIAPTLFDRRFDGWSGWNGAYLELPYRPVLEITNVTEYWGVSGVHVLSESTLTNQIDGFQCEWNTGRVIRVFPGNVVKPWFPGSRNVEIAWTAGFNPVPPDIRLATLEDISEWWRNTQQERGINTSTAVSDYDPATATTGPWDGVPNRVKACLNGYLQVALG